MPNRDRRAAARRKAWGRGPMILRFKPAEGGDGLSVTDPVAEPSSEPTAATMIGLRLLNDEIQAASIAPEPTADTPAAPTPRVRRVIAHKAHSQAFTHHLRLFEPSDTRGPKRSRVPVGPS